MARFWSVSARESALLDMRQRELPDLLRLGIHYYNTESELERFAHELGALAAGPAEL